MPTKKKRVYCLCCKRRRLIEDCLPFRYSDWSKQKYICKYQCTDKPDKWFDMLKDRQYKIIKAKLGNRYYAKVSKKSI